MRCLDRSFSVSSSGTTMRCPASASRASLATDTLGFRHETDSRRARPFPAVADAVHPRRGERPPGARDHGKLRLGKLPRLWGARIAKAERALERAKGWEEP